MKALWLCVFVLLAWSSSVTGQYDEKFLQPIETDPPDGVEVRPDDFTIRIDENNPAGVFVAEIKYTGATAPTVGVINGGPAGSPRPDILITEVDGKYLVEVRTEFDFEQLSTAHIYAVSLNPPLPSPPGIFYIDVVDINDNPPTITNCDGGLAFTIPENEERDFIYQYAATDPDAIDLDQLRFSLQDLDFPDPSSTLFQIGSESGIFSLKPGATLDYEALTSHRIIISVEDSDQIHKAICPMTLVSVEDRPDQPPRWIKFVSSITVLENQPIGDYDKFLYEAVDQDRGVNSSIEYSISGMPENSDNEPFFTIDKDTGELSVSAAIDADVLDVALFQFDAIATEVLDPHESISELVFLTIVDVNDNPPIFDDGSGEKTFNVLIPEGYSETSELPLELDGTIRLNFTISDNDFSPANNQYTAAFDSTEDPEGGVIIAGALRVSPTSGSGKGSVFSVVITDRNRIDYEDPFWRRENIPIVVKVVDNSDIAYFATANVILNVENVNDNDPRFGEGPGNPDADGVLEVDIQEDAKVGDMVVEGLHAVDDDFDDENNFGTRSLRYKWNNRVPPTHLTLDAETGSITVNRANAFDFERVEEENHVIQVCDLFCGDSSRSITFTLRLNILDVNDESPTIYVPPTHAILEEQPWEIDIFSGANITIADVDTSADLEIVLEFLTQAFDDKEKEIDFNDWFTVKYKGNYTEGPANGVSYDLTIIAEPEMVDREVVDRVDFRLTATDKNTHPDFEDKESHFVLFSLTILDINDNPPMFEEDFGDLLSLTYRESTFVPPDDNSSDADREIITFRAFDPDIGDTTLVYYIEPSWPLMGDLVYLNDTQDSRKRGILSRREGVPIDREASDIIPGEVDTDWIGYVITISDGPHNTSVFVNITVEDENDNYPNFTNPVTYFEVSEDASFDGAGYTVVTFAATDRDTGLFGTVSFLLDRNHNGGDGTEEFGIDLESGRLFVKSELDRETKDTYSLLVRAIDNYRPSTNFGSLWTDLVIEIKLLDVNDNAPIFDPNAKLEEIEETAANTGTSFGIINAWDLDLGENKTLSFNLLDVTCSNPNVEDPISMFTIENYPDAEGDDPTGVLIRAAVNFVDKYGVYRLNISASDHGTPSLSTSETFELNVIDVNQHAPIFEFPPPDQPVIFISRGLPVRAALQYYTSPGEEPQYVPPCAATDADDPSTGNGKVVYNLIRQADADDSVEYFIIDRDAGVITVTQSLEDRDGTDFTITVQASDEGSPPLRTNVTLPIKLVPIKNTPPVFATGVEPTIEHPENDGSLRVQLPKATDEDIDDGLNVFNETICYYIGGGDILDEFKLDVLQNLLTLQDGKELDREAVYDGKQLDVYDLQICAINAQTCPSTFSCDGPPVPSPASKLNVTVNVLDVNDESPIFETNENGIISGGIKVDAGIGSLNITVLAIDKDLDDPVTYRFSSPFEVSNPSLPNGEPPFQLDRATGKLDNLFQPQRGMTGYYTFEITADDSFTPVPHSTSVQVKIYLVTEEHSVQFRFSNPPEIFDPLEKRNELANVLTEIFVYQCNVERVVVAVDENGYPIQNPIGRTILQTHFIDTEASEPVVSTIITSERTNFEKMTALQEELEKLGYNLYAFGEDQNNRDPLSTDKVVIYVLIAVLSVVAVSFIVLGFTCWFNNRSLSRRVRALTASTFGSQQSGLNRAGAVDNMLPTTNQFAVQGSNPIWTSEGGYPNFDQESVGSGGSVLIGAEDEDYFNGQNETSNRNYASDGQSSDQIMDDDHDYSYAGPSASAKATDDMPNPLAAVTRRNPLMNLGESDDTFM